MKIIIMALLALTAGTVPLLLREKNEGGLDITRRATGTAVEQGTLSSDSSPASSSRRKPRPAGRKKPVLSKSIPPSKDTTVRRMSIESSSESIVTRVIKSSPFSVEDISVETSDSVRLKFSLSPRKNHSDNQKHVFAKDIAGISTVELPAEDLARLGICVIDLGIYSTSQAEGDTKPSFSINGFIYHESTVNSFLFKDSIENLRKINALDIPDCEPRMVTDDVGSVRRLSYDNDEEIDTMNSRVMELTKLSREGGNLDIRRQIDEELIKERDAVIEKTMNVGGLVPVLVRTGKTFSIEDSLARHDRPDAIFWYRPTQNFLNRLPADIRSRIEQEMALAERLRKNGSADGGDNYDLRAAITSDIKATVGDSPYLDVLRGSGGALAESSISPNPARGNATLKYRLVLPRSIAVTLHDISGRQIRQLSFPGLRSAGEWQDKLDLTGLSNGIYLVVITTQQGERAIQRMIVQQ